MTSSFLPTEAQHFKGRYRVSLGIACLVIGTLSASLNLWIMGFDDQPSRPILLGFIGILISCSVASLGILYLTRPYFGVAPNRLTIYSVLGKVAKRYPFAAFSSLKIENDSLYIESSDGERDSQREKVKIKKWAIRAEDWERLQQIATSSAQQA